MNDFFKMEIVRSKSFKLLLVTISLCVFMVLGIKLYIYYYPPPLVGTACDIINAETNEPEC